MISVYIWLVTFGVSHKNNAIFPLCVCAFLFPFQLSHVSMFHVVEIDRDDHIGDFS